MPASDSAFSGLQFLASAAQPAQLPVEDLPELAFAGRSNVGKSSAINALARRRRLAFFSKTPGRTQTINFFELGDRGRLVDLPGYGFARAARALREEWDRLVGGYLAARGSLAGVVVLMDARRPLTPHDELLLDWLRPAGRPLLVLLSKCDKLSRESRGRLLREVQARMARTDPAAQIRLFSAHSGEGVDEVRALLDDWLRAARGNKKPPVKGM
ncbi:MAG TPA: ribosome biogenesis GTP-binding protein YihA/YsxC [Burkholderiales bacterium]|nr:ribosome biogenesis GTP-binding protein YihA/YsxC [Burkholderiales bacterium]